MSRQKGCKNKPKVNPGADLWKRVGKKIPQDIVDAHRPTGIYYTSPGQVIRGYSWPGDKRLWSSGEIFLAYGINRNWLHHVCLNGVVTEIENFGTGRDRIFDRDGLVRLLRAHDYRKYRMTTTGLKVFLEDLAAGAIGERTEARK